MIKTCQVYVLLKICFALVNSPLQSMTNFRHILMKSVTPAIPDSARHLRDAHVDVRITYCMFAEKILYVCGE